jgi:hypothetical protein
LTKRHNNTFDQSGDSVTLFSEANIAAWSIQSVIEESSMLLRPLIAVIVLLTAQPLCIAQPDGDSETAPQFLVDAEITDSPHGKVFVAAKLYFDQINPSYHVESQRDRPDLGNREQELSILQSKLVKFSVNTLWFRTVDGTTLTAGEAATRLAEKPAVLLVPKDASIHPAIKAVLNPNAVVVSKVRGARPMKLVTRPESR